jgi:hypothetical protein
LNERYAAVTRSPRPPRPGSHAGDYNRHTAFIPQSDRRDLAGDRGVPRGTDREQPCGTDRERAPMGLLAVVVRQQSGRSPKLSGPAGGISIVTSRFPSTNSEQVRMGMQV